MLRAAVQRSAVLRVTAVALLLYLVVLQSTATTEVIGNATSAWAASEQQEYYNESLKLRTLPDGRVHALFSFDIASPSPVTNANSSRGTTFSAYHYDLLPRPLIALTRSNSARELHLSINAGIWNYEKWGNPGIDGGEPAVGTGAEVWATLEEEVPDGSHEEDQVLQQNKKENPLHGVRKSWRGLMASLAGFFCASLDEIDETKAVVPRVAYLDKRKGQKDSEVLVHAQLPTESICTENLTPLLKLLPCKGSAGIASLLRPHSIFAADFHGMGVHVQRQGTHNIENGKEGWDVRLTFQVVYAPAMTNPQGRRGE